MKRIENICDRCRLVIENVDDPSHEDRCMQGGIDRERYAIGNRKLTLDLCRECKEDVEAKIEAVCDEIEQFATTLPESQASV